MPPQPTTIHANPPMEKVEYPTGEKLSMKESAPTHTDSNGEHKKKRVMQLVYSRAKTNESTRAHTHHHQSQARQTSRARSERPRKRGEGKRQEHAAMQEKQGCEAITDLTTPDEQIGEAITNLRTPDEQASPDGLRIKPTL